MRRPAVLPVVILLALSACDGGGAGPAAHPPTPGPAATAAGQPPAGERAGRPSAAVLAGSFRVVERRTVADAAPAVAGKQYAVGLRLAGGAAAGRTLAHLGLTPDGLLVSAANPRPQVVDGVVRIGQSEVRLHGAGTDRPVRAARPAPAGPPRQAVYADADERTTVWLETSSTSLDVVDWRVFAYDRSRARTVVLGDSSEVTGDGKLPMVPGDSTPTVGAGTAYWATAHPVAGRQGFGAKVVARPVTGTGALRTVAAQAKLPAADGADLYYVRSADVAPDLAADRYEIHRVTAGRDRVVASGALPAGGQVTALSAASGRASWVVSGAAEGGVGAVVVWEPAGTAVVFDLDGPGGSTALSSSERLVTWAAGSGAGDGGQYAYEPRTGRLWRLGAAPGLSLAYAAGPYVAWSELGPAAQDPGGVVLARWTAGG
jgi:hypothetical protein